MICSKCGSELEEDAMFCSKCGKKVSSNEEMTIDKKILKSKKKRLIWYMIMGLILVSTIIGIALAVNYKKESQAEKKKQEAAIQNMQKVLDSSSIDLKEYIIEEADIDDYNGLLKELKKAIDNKDVESGDKLVTEIQVFITKINTESKNIISDKLEELNGKDTVKAYDAEKDRISQYSKKIEHLVSEGKYVSALKNANKWESICNLIESEGNYNIAISQIDTLEYPKIKLYLQISDVTDGKEVNIEEFENFLLMEKVKGKYVKKDILSALQLNEEEKLNINLVSDISGSMSEQFDDVKSVMNNFINYIQFDVGDMASLITFDNNVSIDADFTSKKSTLENAVNNMQLGNMTALYDALYVAVSKTSMQKGAKCVIAFTDGYDNDSIRNSDEVIELAQTYKIPIFIIGIGDNIDDASMSNIANMTGGFYENVDSGVSMQTIYDKIYRQQKQLYMLEYETDKSADETFARDVYISYYNDTMANFCIG